MKQNMTFIIAIVLMVITISATSLALVVLETNVLSPGFEGAKCYVYGVDFRFNPQWTGTYTLHRYQDAEQTLARGEPYWQRIYWATTGTPGDVGIGWRTEAGALIKEAWETPIMGIHVESNIQLQDINRQGDPLNWNLTDPSSGRRIEYTSKTAVKEETGDKVLYHYTCTKEVFTVIPAEFWLGFYLVPSQTDAHTGSGWREGEWSNILAWFKLDWDVWDNAYEDSWLNDPEINVFDSPHNGSVLNQQKTWEYRGGFPITAFIKTWEKAGWTSEGGDDESPYWFDARFSKDASVSKTATVSQLALLKNMLMAKVQFTPGMVGQFLSLYNQPSAKFDYEPSIYSSFDFSNNDAFTNYVKTPDSRMKKTMYFPINIQNFGTLVPDGDWWSGYWVYYPTAYFRVRVIYGVYGTFKYLWTEELAKDPVIDYPDEIERHETIVTYTPGVGSWFTGLGDILAGLWNAILIIMGFILAFVIIIVVVPLFFTKKKK